MVKYAVAIVLMTGLAFGRSGSVRPFADRKFDHAKHAATTGKTIECAHCHPTSSDGKATLLDSEAGMRRDADHAFCQGSGCHGTFDTTSCATLTSSARAAQHQVEACNICHAVASSPCLSGTLKPTPRPAPAFGHGHHVGRGSPVEDACLACHDARAHGTAPLAKAPHALCSTCHAADKRAPMTACATCHKDAAPAPAAPHATDPFHIESFAHAAHMAKTPKALCIDCHGRRNGPADDATVRATMVPAFDPNNPRATPELRGTCAGCHDGGRAFNVVGTTCTKCHAPSGSALPPPRTKADVVFSHDDHEHRYGVKMADCASCHAIKADGTIDRPGVDKDHQPCAASGCHAARDFSSKGATICGVCHDAAGAWAKTASRARTPSKLEWFQNINHAAHLKNPNVQCETCHGTKLNAATTAPHNHDDCAPCHGKGQQPPIAACAACHSKVAPVRATASAWSVAKAFDHGKHGRDNKAAPPTCVSCHASVPAATKLADITAPRMLTEGTVKGCDTCHDGKSRINGKVVFKTTGFACAKCHAKPQVAANP